MNLLDSSALLCFLQGERGSETAERALATESACSAVSWSEAAQKVLAAGRDWSAARALLSSYGLVVVPVVVADAEAAARRWRRGGDLTLADRLCLATAERLDATVWTADRAWGDTDRVRQVR